MRIVDAAVAAVVGASIGAGATVLGSLLTARQQAAQRHTEDVRQRKEAAYSNAIRSLLRARNRRTAMSAEGMTFIAEEDIGTFFDDVVDAQHWLAVLATACGAKQRPAIDQAGARLNETVDRIVKSGSRALDKRELLSGPVALTDVYDDVVAAARDDLGTQSA
jgi:hypothetical protein